MIEQFKSIWWNTALAFLKDDLMNCFFFIKLTIFRNFFYIILDSNLF